MSGLLLKPDKDQPICSRENFAWADVWRKGEFICRKTKTGKSI